MKTKFFKKLSFVLVVAMVLSLLVPAAGVFAATKPELNSTNKYLHLGRDDANEFNFNINNKQKGWQYYWESADEDVVVVNEANGVVTAVGVGKTVVSVDITDADDNEVDTLVAAVTVRDNIAEVTIKNPVEGTLGVNAEYDFNRSFVTESGSTKKTDSITRWEVDSEDASIDPKGVFVATKAGEYKVTARSFQSKARYNAWMEDDVKYADYVLDDAETTVVVAGSMLEAKQVDLDTFKVFFDSKMDKDAVKANLKVSLLIGTVKSPQYVKSVALDEEDASVAIVDMYGPFSKGMTYIAEYTDMEDVDFKAASSNYADVVRMEIDTKSVVASVAGGEEEEIKFKLFNADGVNITDGSDSDFSGALKDRVYFETDSTGAYIDGKNISIFEVGTVAEVKGTYSTYVYDDNGKEIGTVLAIGQIVGTKEATVPAGALNKYTVTLDKKAPEWSKDPVTKVAIEANDPRLFAFVKNTNDVEIKSDNTEYENDFKFESSNDNVLYVAPNGELYPVKEGSIVVIIKFKDTIVGYANITVVPKSKAVAFSLSEYQFTLSNDKDVADSKDIKITLKDQYENDIDVDEFELTKLTTSTDIEAYINYTRDGKTITFTVDAKADADEAKGKVVYEVKVNGIKRTLNITLDAPNDKVATDIRYRLDMSKTIDLAVGEEADLDKKLEIKLIGYAPNNIKTTADVASDAGFKLIITGPQDDLEDGSALYGRDKDDANAITKIKTGTYKVVAKQILDGDKEKVWATEYITVTDKQKSAGLTKVLNANYEKESLVDIANECFEIKIDGNAHDGVKDVVIGAGSIHGSIYIKEIKVLQKFGDRYIVHTVKIGMTVYPTK